MEQLWDNTRFFKAGLQALGFNTGLSESPITPVIVGEAPQAMAMSDRLFEAGVFAQGIGFPTVARGQARLRTIVDGHAHARRPAVRAGHVRQGGQGTGGHLNTSVQSAKFKVQSQP